MFDVQQSFVIGNDIVLTRFTDKAVGCIPYTDTQLRSVSAERIVLSSIITPQINPPETTNESKTIAAR
jgi:hypothetical protein